MRVMSQWLVAVLLGCGGFVQAAELAELRDGIDTAVRQADGETLATLAQETGSATGDWAAYYQAYVLYRQSQVEGTKKKVAKQQLNDCIDTLEDLLKKRPDMVEAYALLATCYGNSANYYMLRAASRGSSANKALEEALRLDSGNPRVLLQEAQSLIFRPAIFGGDKEKAMERLQLAAELFVNWQSADPEAPVWGQAETWFFIGTLHREADDTAAAREALQKALEVAPDYVAAQNELKELG